VRIDGGVLKVSCGGSEMDDVCLGLGVYVEAGTCCTCHKHAWTWRGGRSRQYMVGARENK
jgi:hypothetical protein